LRKKILHGEKKRKGCASGDFLSCLKRSESQFEREEIGEGVQLLLLHRSELSEEDLGEDCRDEKLHGTRDEHGGTLRRRMGESRSIEEGSLSYRRRRNVESSTKHFSSVSLSFEGRAREGSGEY
jgi:hypothetical protein